MNAERNQAILDGLRGVTPDNPVWKSVRLILEHQIELADRMTLEDGITTDQRSLYAGREWALRQFDSTLRILHAKANPANAPGSARPTS